MHDPAHSPDRQDAPERLIERYVDGDEEAFESLVGLYEERLFAFIARFVGDSHLAEDVFQQTFVKVAINALTFDGRASFSTWLFRIARNTALDELRRRRRNPVADGEYGRMEYENRADASSLAPLDKLEQDELSERVRTALAGIPQPQREAFLLKEEGGFDFAEIGEILGCGRETAKSRFRLAVGKLRESLGMDGSRT